MLRRSNRLISEFLERRSLLASITWDGGGDGTSWSSANNWSTNSIPTSNDDVTINAGPALVNVNADAVAKSIQCSAPLSLSASLSVTNGATYHALFTWTQGALIGSHTFSAASDATFSGPGIKRMDDVVINQGELTYTGTNLQFSSATLTNSGFIYANNSGSFTSSDGSMNTFNNAFSFSKSGLSTVTFDGVSVVNSGEFSISAGQVDIAAGGSTTALIFVGTNAKLRFTQGNFVINMLNGIALDAHGRVQLVSSSASITLAEGLNQQPEISNLDLIDGTLDGNDGGFHLTGTFNWQAGSMFGSIGTAINSVTMIETDGIKIVHDQLMLDGNSTYDGDGVRLDSAVMQNVGTLNLLSGSITKTGSGPSVFYNNQVLNKETTSTFTFDSVPLMNHLTLNVNGGTLTTNNKIGDISSGDLHIGASGTLITPSYLQGHVVVDGLLTLAGDNVLSTCLSLTLNGSGSVDMGNNAIVLNYSGNSPLPALRAKIISGRNNGAWNGVGIRSSTAANDPTTAIGFGESEMISGTLPAPFMDGFIDDSSFVMRHTKIGDANLNHAVNFSDLLIVAQNYEQTSRVWAQGNFSFDAGGNVDFADLLLIAQRYGDSLPELSERRRLAKIRSDRIEI